ncbi:MAG: DUF3574 domain-containing protein [Kiritimatiellia bacterium]
MKIKTQWINAVAALLLSEACTFAEESSVAFMKTELFFRLGGEGIEVSDKAWNDFMDHYVTPRFEQYVEVVDVTGQFMGEQRRDRISMKVLMCLHENTAAADASIDYIRSSYARLFKKDAVIRVSVPVAASFQQDMMEGESRELAVIQNREIRESSGLAYSPAGKPVLWTHNDSGDESRFFAVGLKGEDLGTFTLDGAIAEDWEDIAGFVLDQKGWLLIADTGDNELNRATYQLYIVEEPPAGASATVSVTRTINFVYEDGPHNCEAVAVDAREKIILLVVKTSGPVCGVYELPLDSRGEKPAARRIGELRLSSAVAMDISPDGRDVVVLTYGDALRYRRAEGEGWAEVFSREPQMLPMPYRRQGESVCYTPDGKNLLLTSEKRPSPLLEMTLP